VQGGFDPVRPIVDPLDPPQRARIAMRLGLVEQTLERIDVEDSPGAQDQQPFDDVPELAHVPRPGAARQGLAERVGEDGQPAPQARTQLARALASQLRDVLATRPKRRNLESKHIEAEVEIAAKPALAHFLAELPARRSNHPGARVQGRNSADAFEFTVLEHPQQLRLQTPFELADLVEEKGSGSGALEAAGAPGECACEGASLVAEELGLDQAG
jgi:hypothetical protein